MADRFTRLMWLTTHMNGGQVHKTDVAHNPHMNDGQVHKTDVAHNPHMNGGKVHKTDVAHGPHMNGGQVQFLTHNGPRTRSTNRGSRYGGIRILIATPDLSNPIATVCLATRKLRRQCKHEQLHGEFRASRDKSSENNRIYDANRLQKCSSISGNYLISRMDPK